MNLMVSICSWTIVSFISYLVNIRIIKHDTIYIQENFHRIPNFILIYFNGEKRCLVRKYNRLTAIGLKRGSDRPNKRIEEREDMTWYIFSREHNPRDKKAWRSRIRVERLAGSQAFSLFLEGERASSLEHLICSLFSFSIVLLLLLYYIIN